MRSVTFCVPLPGLRRALDVFGFHEMAKPIKVGDLTFAYGYEFDTIVVTPTMYLAWLKDTVASSGVRIIQRRVGSLAELTGFDVVVRARKSGLVLRAQCEGVVTDSGCLSCV